jgi:hypothetical protein
MKKLKRRLKRRLPKGRCLRVQAQLGLLRAVMVIKQNGSYQDFLDALSGK